MTITITAECRKTYMNYAQLLVNGDINIEEISEKGISTTMPVFTVSKVAQLASIHPQTLRQYDRFGLIVPQRTSGGARRYSLHDIYRLLQTQKLSQLESINLLGIARILSLSEENQRLRKHIKRLSSASQTSVFAVGSDGQMTQFHDRQGTGADNWRASLYKVLQITDKPE